MRSMSFLIWCPPDEACGNNKFELAHSPSWDKDDRSPATPDDAVRELSPERPTLLPRLPVGSAAHEGNGKAARDHNLDRTPTWARDQLDFRSLSEVARTSTLRSSNKAPAAADLAVVIAPPRPASPATEDPPVFPQSRDFLDSPQGGGAHSGAHAEAEAAVTPVERPRKQTREDLARLREEAERERQRLQEEAEADRQRLQEEAEAEKKRLQDEAEQMRKYMQEELDRERARRDELAQRAALEAAGRRKLENHIERERRQKEEAAESRELLRMQAEEEEQRALEAAHASAVRRIEEENRHAARAVEERRAAEEAAARERERLHAEAQRRSDEAQQERESRELVKAFLSEHGHRHVRAKTAQWTMANTYPLHRAVSENDPEMVRLLLQIKADPTQTNGWGNTPLSYARSRGKRGAGGAVAALLEAASARASAS